MSIAGSLWLQLESNLFGWVIAAVVLTARLAAWLDRLKGKQMPQTIDTILTDLDFVLTFAVKHLPGTTVDEKRSAVNNFINPRIQTALTDAGASPFLASLVVGLVDFAINSEVSQHFPA